MTASEAPKPRGLLHPDASAFQHQRILPGLHLQPWIAHHWFVSWDLRDQKPHTQQTLPHPCTHLVHEGSSLRVYGVSTRPFTRTLKGKGQIHGVKFRPAAFTAWTRRSLADLRDQALCAHAFFDGLPEGLEPLPQTQSIERLESFLCAGRLCDNMDFVQVRDLVEAAERQPAWCSVEDLVAATGLSKRTLQRRFRAMIGVSPKWVLRRYRLHELLERLQQEDVLDWADTAYALGYCDQAHLIRDFKQTLGLTPARYAALCTASSPKQA